VHRAGKVKIIITFLGEKYVDVANIFTVNILHDFFTVKFLRDIFVYCPNYSTT